MSLLRDFSPQGKRFSVEEVVWFYRSLGFFGSGDSKDSAANVVARYQKRWGVPPDPMKPWDDVRMLALDEARVWRGDPQGDVCRGKKAYVKTLQEWSRVSQGAFKPQDIEEIWGSDTGPISVHLTLGGLRRTLKPDWDDDWLDLNILTTINELIAKSGKQLACASEVNFAIVFATDEDGRERLERVRGFPFVL